jgi:hypothetical protein
MASGVCPLKAEIYRRCREAERSAMEHDFHWTKSRVALGSAVILLRANATRLDHVRPAAIAAQYDLIIIRSDGAV